MLHNHDALAMLERVVFLESGLAEVHDSIATSSYRILSLEHQSRVTFTGKLSLHVAILLSRNECNSITSSYRNYPTHKLHFRGFFCLSKSHGNASYILDELEALSNAPL